IPKGDDLATGDRQGTSVDREGHGAHWLCLLRERGQLSARVEIPELNFADVVSTRSRDEAPALGRKGQVGDLKRMSRQDRLPAQVTQPDLLLTATGDGQRLAVRREAQAEQRVHKPTERAPLLSAFHVPESNRLVASGGQRLSIRAIDRTGDRTS